MPSLANIQKVLNNAKFNPKKPGPLNVVSHSAGPSYLELRAQEFILEAQEKREDLKNLATIIVSGAPSLAGTQEEDKVRFQDELRNYKHQLTRAIQCLSLAIVKVENAEF